MKNKFEAKGKIDQHNQLVVAHRKLFGIGRIPEDQGYWGLCSRQRKVPASEIEQLVLSGLITYEQYFGVDRDWDDLGSGNRRITYNIEQNKIDHPSANWYKGDLLDTICGNWNPNAETYNKFRPAILFYDSQHTAHNQKVYFAKLMNCVLACPIANVMVAANVMLETGRDSKQDDPAAFFERLDLDGQKWYLHPERYEYRCEPKRKSVLMTTFIFVKK